MFCKVFFFPKNVSFMRKCGKTWWNQTSHRQYNMAHAQFTKGYLRLQIHTFGICINHCFSPATTRLTVRLRLKRDDTHAETRFLLSAKRTSPFNSAGASVQSTTGSRGVRIFSSNAVYTMFWGSEGYWLATSFASFPFTSPPVRHRVPSHINWTLHHTYIA